MVFEDVYDTVAGLDELDIRELGPDTFPYSFYSDYLNTPEVLQALTIPATTTSSSNRSD